jgi:hypothetical protein
MSFCTVIDPSEVCNNNSYFYSSFIPFSKTGYLPNLSIYIVASVVVGKCSNMPSFQIRLDPSFEVVQTWLDKEYAPKI